jgi:precorrin-6B methylase 2
MWGTACLPPEGYQDDEGRDSGSGMLQVRLRRFAVALAMVVIAAGPIAARAQLPATRDAGGLPAAWFEAASPQTSPLYEVRAIHDPNGTGRFYLGREIAQVMGAGGMPWLDRPEREAEELPEVVIEAMGLHAGEVVADLGAGSGYFTFRLAVKVGKTGKVLAVDIQDEMLATIRQRAAALGVTNVEEVKDTETDPRLPLHSIDCVLLVDVYHELAYPFEVMTRVREALRPGGRVVFVEYRKEDTHVRIKEVHKMSVEQLTKEMNAVGLDRAQTVESLPSQHIVIFVRHGDGRPPG